MTVAQLHGTLDEVAGRGEQLWREHQEREG